MLKFQLNLFIKSPVRAFIFIFFHQGYVSLHLSVRWCFFVFLFFCFFKFVHGTQNTVCHSHCHRNLYELHWTRRKLVNEVSALFPPSENNGVWRNTSMNIVNCHTQKKTALSFHLHSQYFRDAIYIYWVWLQWQTHSANCIAVEISNLPPTAHIILFFFFSFFIGKPGQNWYSLCCSCWSWC